MCVGCVGGGWVGVGCGCVCVGGGGGGRRRGPKLRKAVAKGYRSLRRLGRDQVGPCSLRRELVPARWHRSPPTDSCCAAGEDEAQRMHDALALLLALLTNAEG